MNADTLDNDSLLKGKAVQRLTVTNEAGEQVIYNSRKTEIYVYVYLGSKSDIHKLPYVNNLHVKEMSSYNLERIIYPSGAETRYSYIPVYVADTGLRMRKGIYAVSGIYDYENDSRKNKRNYTLIGTSVITIEEENESK